MKKTKIAFIKFAGLAAGGTERYLQTIAAFLPKDKYDVTYFYTNAAPYVGSDWKHPDNDPSRKKFLVDHGVELVEVQVAAKDVTKPHHPWLGTNLWDLFKEEDYDVVQAGRAGHPEYPFTEITNIPMVDIITLPGMAERKANVHKTIHISKFQADSWVQAGGDPSRILIIPIFSEMLEKPKEDFRKQLGIKEHDFVFGMHQRDDNGIASPVPLQAFKALQKGYPSNHFVLMGGGSRYQEFADQLQLKNFHRLPHDGDDKVRDKFLATLDVFAHGRADGETYGLSIAEAMSFGLPVISHVAPAMGHVETIGNAGIVVDSVQAYADEMTQLILNLEYREARAKNALKEYDERLSLKANIKKITAVYDEIMELKKIDEMPDEDFWNDMWAEDK